MDLQKFCGNRDDERMGRPWSVEQWTLATDGKIMIRVPRVEGVEENPKATKCLSGEVGRAWNKEPAEWVPCPRLPEPCPVPCPVCDGSGKVFLCPECDGAGEVLLETDFNDYGEFECLSCRGRGRVSKVKWLSMTGISIDDAACCCERCGGRGATWDDKPVEVNGVLFGDRYLSWIGALPESEIGAFGEGKAARFRFRGGEGLLMPRRR